MHPNPRHLSKDIEIIKTIRTATGEKRYTPMVLGKRLRLSWKTHTNAKRYGRMVLNRYIAKKNVQSKQNKE